MIRPLTSLSLALVGVAFADAQAIPWLNRQILSRIQTTGYRYLGYHYHQVDGDLEAFNSLTYYGQGARRFTDTGQIHLSGREVLGMFNFDATIVDSRFKDPQNERFSLNFRKGAWSVDAGDIQGSLLNSNPFASFNKSLKGASIQYRKGPFAIKALRTDTKGDSRTVTLQGINSAGPYYLASSQIIQGSEVILVDDVQMELQRDYVINYEIGSITFVNRIIPPTSTIIATYESLNFNSGAGTVQGAGATLDLGKFGRAGLTFIEQKSRSGGGISSRVEQFEGFGAPGTPYFLQFEPLSTAQYPTTVRVNGVLQVQGVDYYFDNNNKSIFYFTRFIPSTSIVEVAYFPRPTSAANGDRRVTGIDYRLPFARGGYLQYSQAVGELRHDVTPSKGTAKGLGVNYKSGPLELRAGWRDVPNTFVGIESRGFNRNEKAVDFSAEYTKKGFTHGVAHQNSAVSTRTFDQSGNVAISSGRQTTSKLYTNYTSDSWMWNAEQARRTVKSVRGSTKLDTTSLFASKKWGKIDTRFGFDHQTGSAPDGSGKNSSIALDSLRLDVDYRPTKDLELGFRSSLSKVRYGAESGNGRDYGLRATYRPNEQWLIEGSYDDSNSGALSALSGFEGSIGFDGNGFSSGSSGTAFSAGSTNLQLANLHARYESGGRLALDARITKSRSSGSLYTNTDTTFVGLGVDYDLGRGHAISLGLEQSDTKFLNSPNRSNVRSLTFGFAGRPPGPWSYRLGANAQLSGGGQFAQDSIGLDGSLHYRINDRQQVYGMFNVGRTTGYLPQQDQFFGVFYEYRLFQNVALIGSYKVRTLNNLDPLFTSGQYRSRGFDLELSFTFGN